MYRRYSQSAAGAVAAAAVVLFSAASVLAPRPAAAQENLGPLDEPVSTALMARLEKVSEHGLEQTPEFDMIIMKRIEGGKARNGTPLVLYLGAGFCPYCAALRWPLALTLMRFGDLSGLRYTRSSGKDVYPNTATFSFAGTQLASALIDFQAVEFEDRNGKRLQQPDDAQRKIFMQLDKQPYTQYPGSIPFLYVAGRYVQVGSPFRPDPLEHKDWDQITQDLEKGGNAAWRSIMGETNLLTAAVCAATGGKPGKVCTASGVKAAAAQLPN
jgi:hypothetical protein